jgi:hypothetical protein
MAQPICHHAPGSSTSMAQVLRSLAADLERSPLELPPEGYLPREARLVAVFEVLLRGTEAALSRQELNYLRHLDVPRALVAGDTRER